MRKLIVCIVSVFALLLFLSADTKKILRVSAASPDEETTIISKLSVMPLNEEPKVWPIQSFDVNEDGFVVLGFYGQKNAIVAVYSPQKEFLYGYAFKSTGSFSVSWNDENVCIYHVRGEMFTIHDEDGNCIKAVNKNVEEEEFDKLKANTAKNKRIINGISYQLINDMIVGGEYGRLVVTYPNGETDTFYDASVKHNIRIVVYALGVSIWFALSFAYVYMKRIKRKT